jgi:tetratricopeptide (TPR) repeat protein
LDQDWRTVTPPFRVPEWPLLLVSLQGRLEAALGETTAALRKARQLDTMTDSPGASGLAHTMGQDIRALVSGPGSAETLRYFDSDSAKVWFGLLVSDPADSRAFARFARAEMLDRLGRPQEALRWYASLDELSTSDLVYSAPAHLRRADIFERLGDLPAAAAEYSRFLELWKDADPELMPSCARLETA